MNKNEKSKKNKNVMKTFSACPKDLKRKWYIIDATDLILGRMAVVIADCLRGKNKPIFTPNQDCGDYVIVINSDKIYLSGNKLEDKIYYSHSNHPGGLKEVKAKDLMKNNKSEKIIENAVRKMITRNSLGDKIMKKLYIYSSETHPHTSKKPEMLDLRSMNVKNSKRN